MKTHRWTIQLRVFHLPGADRKLCGHWWRPSTQKHDVCHIVVFLRGGASGSKMLKIHIKNLRSQALLYGQGRWTLKTVKEVYTYTCHLVYLVCICKSGGIMHCSKKRTRQYPKDMLTGDRIRQTASCRRCHRVQRKDRWDEGRGFLNIECSYNFSMFHL